MCEHAQKDITAPRNSVPLLSKMVRKGRASSRKRKRRLLHLPGCNARVAAGVVAVDAAGARICALGTTRRSAPVGYAVRLPEATKYGIPHAVPTSFIVKAKGL